VSDWVDGEDPYALVTAAMGGSVSRFGVADALPALHVIPLTERLDARPELATPVLREPHDQGRGRDRRTAPRRRGDRRGAPSCSGLLRAGRTEREVGADIAAAIVEGTARSSS
jgi:hypothetical protein